MNSKFYTIAKMLENWGYLNTNLFVGSMETTEEGSNDIK